MSSSSLVRRYDRDMYDALIREFYHDSDFLNYGYWANGARAPKEASEALVDELLGFLPERRGSILDVACGLGATTRHLLRSFTAAQVVGINLSEKQLRTARLNAPNCRFLAMDAATLAFRDSTFDNVICVEAAFHFNTREAFVREAYRVLAPGGTLVLSDILMGKVLPGPVNRKRWIAENLFTDLDDYREIYRRAGFDRIEIRDATAACWRSFYQHLRDFGWRKLRAREMTVRRFVKYAILWNVARLFTRHYLLVSARKT